MARSVCLMIVLVAAASFVAVNASVDRKLLAPSSPAPTKAAVKAACKTIDFTKQATKLCVAQNVFVKGTKKPVLVTPVTVGQIISAADAACVAYSVKYAFADPAGSAWGGAVGKCFNGLKYASGATWTKLQCCEAGASASALARARETAAEMGLTQGTLDLARARETAAEIGTTQGQLDTPQAAGSGLARARDTAAENGVTVGSLDTTKPDGAKLP